MTDSSLIKKIVVAEKATDLSKIGKYVFIVEPSATKNEVKKAIKSIYGVDVKAVNIIRRGPKTRHFRGVTSRRGGYKKAVVTLASGQKIDISR